MTGHPFRPIKHGSSRCQLCGGWDSDSTHSLELFTDADRDRESARQFAEAEELTQAMRRPLADVSRKAGQLERESPLFFGKGDSPCLF